MLFSKLLVMFLCTLLGRQTYSSPCERKDKVQMTVMSFKPRFSQSTSAPLPHYECYLGAEDEDATITAVRAYQTSRLDLPGPTSIEPINGLPAHYVTLQTTSDGAFGVFNCTAVKAGRQDTTIMTIFLRSDSVMWPSDGLFTQTVNTGYRGIIIDMTPAIIGDTFWWRINGSDRIQDPSRVHGYYESEDYRRIPNPISGAGDGLYECHYADGLGRTTRHAMQRLMVRACSSSKWGPPGCTGVCDHCYNGGICDDETGRCICSPGFMGPNCLEACGGNRFGYSCEFECDPGGPENSCEERLFCLLDPFGCRCNTGFTDLNCNDTCSSGSFGSNCLQSCHCSGSEGRCNSYTGVCESGNCDIGWSGTNCQIPDSCPVGYYGGDCTKKCRCKDDSSCDKTTGICENGMCSPGSVEGNNSVCQECPDDYFGDSCTEECHCAADSCDKGTGDCVGCCNDPRWIETPQHPCQQGLTNSSYDKVNPGQSSAITCFAERVIDVVPVIALSRSPVVAHQIGAGGFGTNIGPSDRPGLTRWSRRMIIIEAQPTDEYYCLLLETGTNDVLAWLKTSFFTYVLPTISTAPMLVFRNHNSITISWRAWENGTDVGDPPVVMYRTYIREGDDSDWEFHSIVPSGLQSSFDNLKTDANYSFSVAAVRELTGGEGPLGPAVTLKTLCAAPTPPSDVIVEIVDSNLVNVTWETSTNETCSIGVTGYTIYYHKEGVPANVQTVSFASGATTWMVVGGLDPGSSYVFSVSLTTDQESDASLSSTAVVLPPEEPGTVFPVGLLIGGGVLLLVLVITAVVIVCVIVKRREKGDARRDVSAVYINDAAHKDAKIDQSYDTKTVQSYEVPDQTEHTLRNVPPTEPRNSAPTKSYSNAYECIDDDDGKGGKIPGEQCTPPDIYENGTIDLARDPVVYTNGAVSLPK